MNGTETCACGASITVDVKDGLVLGWRLTDWRREHRHDLDAADACRERDEAVACAVSAERDALNLRRALAQAEHERDEALAEATRLADILTNCGYWG